MPGSSFDSIAPKEANEHMSNAQAAHAFVCSGFGWLFDCLLPPICTQVCTAQRTLTIQSVSNSAKSKGHVGSSDRVAATPHTFLMHYSIKAVDVTTTANVKCADDNYDEWRC